MKLAALHIFALLFVFSAAAYAQPEKDTPLVAIDGSLVVIGDGWKVLRTFNEKGPDSRVGMVYSWETGSVVRSAPDAIRAWVKVKDYKNTELQFRKYRYEIRCGAKQLRIVEMVDVSKDGTPESTKDDLAPFEEFKPKSMKEMVFNGVCDAQWQVGG